MTAPQPSRVLIADDHQPTREDVRFALEQDERFEVCAEAVDAPGAIEAALRERPGICLLDVKMPGWGVAAAWEIHARLPQTLVVMLTVSRDDLDLFAALRAGAVGYLLKDMDPRRLPGALESVLEGEVVIPRELVGHVVEEFRDRSSRRRELVSDGPQAKLTSREWEVLELLRQELSTSQIARRLVLSPVTVRTHVNAILRKLEIRDREELVRQFPRKG
jgi:DNA-binding NarL/FixJ family response regulator